MQMTANHRYIKNNIFTKIGEKEGTKSIEKSEIYEYFFLQENYYTN